MKDREAIETADDKLIASMLDFLTASMSDEHIAPEQHDLVVHRYTELCKVQALTDIAQALYRIGNGMTRLSNNYGAGMGYGAGMSYGAAGPGGHASFGGGRGGSDEPNRGGGGGAG